MQNTRKPSAPTHCAPSLITASAPEGALPHGVPRLLTDIELAPILRVSVGFLQRDRREGKRIPHIKLGDRVLYDLDGVLEAVRGMTIGGGLGRRRRIGEPRRRPDMDIA